MLLGIFNLVQANSTFLYPYFLKGRKEKDLGVGQVNGHLFPFNQIFSVKLTSSIKESY
jgi:hypothetical protein